MNIVTAPLSRVSRDTLGRALAHKAGLSSEDEVAVALARDFSAGALAAALARPTRSVKRKASSERVRVPSVGDLSDAEFDALCGMIPMASELGNLGIGGERDERATRVAKEMNAGMTVSEMVLMCCGLRKSQ